MKAFHRPRTGDVIEVPDALAKHYDDHPDWKSGKPSTDKSKSSTTPKEKA